MNRSGTQGAQRNRYGVSQETSVRKQTQKLSRYHQEKGDTQRMTGYRIHRRTNEYGVADAGQ